MPYRLQKNPFVVPINNGKLIEEHVGLASTRDAQSGTRVRYSNPFDEECEYWSICMPAFSLAEVNREKP